jgi:uncharacterized protein
LKSLEQTEIKVAGKTIKVWIMDNPSKRAEGMMWLQDDEVPADAGMLFVFLDEEPLSFWMRNTLIPLDIAYINRRGTLLNIQQGKALDEGSLPSKGPSMYVLEMKLGAMKRLGIREGARVEIPARIRAKD